MRCRTRRAYVLLLTLVLLALAAVALHTVVLHSMRAALNSVSVQEDLQRRWGMLSCQATLLPNVSAILKREEDRRKAPIPALRTSLTLGQQQFDLILGDEQAKANVNALYDRMEPADLQRALRDLAGAESLRASPVLRPLRDPVRPSDKFDDQADLPGPTRRGPPPNRPPNAPRSGNASHSELPRPGPHPTTTPTTGPAQLAPAAAPPAFETYAQVFPTLPPAGLLGREGPGPAINLTCWGAPQLNFPRAGEPAIRQVCSPLLSEAQIRNLLTTRARAPNDPLSKMLDDLSLGRPLRTRVERLLTERSSCYSLWIIDRTGLRESYRLAVSTAAGGQNRPLCYEW